MHLKLCQLSFIGKILPTWWYQNNEKHRVPTWITPYQVKLIRANSGYPSFIVIHK